MSSSRHCNHLVIFPIGVGEALLFPFPSHSATMRMTVYNHSLHFHHVFGICNFSISLSSSQSSVISSHLARFFFCLVWTAVAERCGLGLLVPECIKGTGFGYEEEKERTLPSNQKCIRAKLFHDARRRSSLLSSRGKLWFFNLPLDDPPTLSCLHIV